MEMAPNTYNGLCLLPDEIVKFGQIIESKSKRDERSGCILWTRCTNAKGYGWQRIRGTYTSAHRIAYAVHIGPVPADMQVCHRCDVRRCVNVDHLFLGTPAENQNDKGRKHRSKMKLQPEDVIKIREMRSKGMTQRSIADSFNVGRSTIQGITNGGFRPYVTDRAS
jgi:DNA-binding XRE family transcriptional regulator